MREEPVIATAAPSKVASQSLRRSQVPVWSAVDTRRCVHGLTFQRDRNADLT